VSDICHFTSDQLVFVDESASNERSADRRWGWSTRGDPCRVRQSGKRSKRWSILPAITINGYIAWEIYQDSFTTERFNRFIRHDLMPYMTAFPGPRSVLIMDNCSIHHSEELTALCAANGVLLIYLPPYSPDMNPIEQSFARLKAWMRRNQRLAGMMGGNFSNFLGEAVRSMSQRDCRGHFRRCGYAVPPDIGDDEDDSAESSSDEGSIDFE
jgi:transposase